MCLRSTSGPSMNPRPNIPNLKPRGAFLKDFLPGRSDDVDAHGRHEIQIARPDLFPGS